MKYLVKWIAWILVVVGALNWGLVGFFQFNLVESLFGIGSTLTMVIYDLVGLSAIVLIIFKMMRMSGMKKKK